VFRTATGFKAQYHHLTLLVAADFDEWKVVLEGPGIMIHGCRQFTEGKAKDHALVVARGYFAEAAQERLPDPQAVEWAPLAAGEWLNWRP